LDAPTTEAATLLKIRASRHLASIGKYADAVNVLGGVQQSGASIIRRQLQWLLDSSATEHNTTGTAEAGLAILQQFASWFPADEQARFYNVTAIALAQIDRDDEARAVADQFARIDAETAASLQHEVEFLRRRKQIAQTDPVARYKLGVWAREMGLFEEATSLFDSLRTEPVVAENALLQMQLIELDRGKRELERINDMYKAERYDEVIKAVRDFQTHYSEPQLTRRAAELEQLAKYGQWSRAKRLPNQAQAAYQNAERLMNQGRIDEARAEAMKVVADYPGSPAAKQAEILLEKVARRK
jgi:tetratricopeptide (TPR) repeat protein